MSSTDERLVALVEKQAAAIRTLQGQVEELREASEPEPEPEPAVDKPWAEMTADEKVTYTNQKYADRKPRLAG